MPSVLRTTFTAATLLLVAGVAAAAVLLDSRIAALLLAGGLAVAAGLRVVVPDGYVPMGRGRAFDVTVLSILALAAALLAPWGLALSP